MVMRHNAAKEKRVMVCQRPCVAAGQTAAWPQWARDRCSGAAGWAPPASAAVMAADERAATIEAALGSARPGPTLLAAACQINAFPCHTCAPLRPE